MKKCLFCDKVFIPTNGNRQKYCSYHCSNTATKRGKKRPEHSKMMLGENNPNWKNKCNGGYVKLHEFIKRRLIQPKICSSCGKNKKLDLANISQEYKQDLSDWKWLCRSCHKLEHYKIKNEALTALRAFLE